VCKVNKNDKYNAVIKGKLKYQDGITFKLTLYKLNDIDFAESRVIILPY